MNIAASRRAVDAGSLVRTSRLLRRGLLLSSALVPVLALSVMTAPTAFAEGGAGGYGTAGGADSATSAGAGGGSGAGGGAGATGGAGGAATGPGGAGGATAGAAGAAGQNDGEGNPGGGGGGGAHGYVGSVLPASGILVGGNGGNGAGANLASGGGGAGGWGAVITGSGPYDWSPTSLTVIKGGDGGAAGAALSVSGSGGSGGIGVYFTSDVSVNIGDLRIDGGDGGGGSITGVGGAALVFAGAATVTLSGTVIGGDAGYGGLTSGGAGISVLGNATLTLASSAAVLGGVNADGTTRTNAIQFTGGTNLLELQGNGGTSSQTYAMIAGNVVGSTGATDVNTLAFGGAGGVFNLSQIDVGSGSSADVVFKNFDFFDVDTTGTWIMTGGVTAPGSNPLTVWNVKGGTLQLGNAATLGALPGNVEVSTGGTLANGAKGGDVVGSIAVTSGGTLAVSAVSGASALKTLQGDLTLYSGASLNVTLSAPTTATALITVGDASVSGSGDLTLGGTLNITDSGSMAEGTYLLIGYAGSLTGTIGVGTAPTDYIYTVDTTTTAGQVLLTVSGAGLYWNGGPAASGGGIIGGSGTWAPTNDNWTNAAGTTNEFWNGSTAIFAGTGGIISIEDNPGQTSVKGMRFEVDGYAIFSSSITLNASSGPTEIEVATGATATIGSTLIGTTGLEKTGAGTLSLWGANTYTGDTTVSAGTLQIGSAGSLGAGSYSGAISLASGTLFDYASSAAQTLSGAISGAGSLTVSGAGTLTLSGSNTYSGATTVSAGTLVASGGAAIGDSSAVTVAKDASLQLNANETVGSLAGAGTVTLTNVSQLTAGGDNSSTTFSGEIAGTGNLQKTGTGTLTLSGANSFVGVVTVSAGALQLSGGSVLASTSELAVSTGATLELVNGSQSAANLTGEGTVKLNTNTLTVGVNNGTGTFAGTITGTGGLTKVGSLTQTLSGANTFTGPVQVSAGKLFLQNGSAIADSAAVTVDAGAELVLFLRSETIGSLAGGGAVISAGGSSTLTTGGNNTSTTFAGTLSGVGSATIGLVKTGTGTMTLTGANTYSGGTTISGGTLQIGGGGTTGSITGDVVNNASLVFNRTDSLTFSGAISGTGSVEQAGTGTLTLSGSNTYTGATTVSAGTLVASGGSAIGDSSAVTVAKDASLTVSGEETIGSLAGAGALTLDDASVLSAGGDNSSTTFSGTISGTGSLIKEGSGTLTLTGGNSMALGAIGGAEGTLVLADGTWSADYAVLGSDVGTSAALTVTGADTSLDLGTGNMVIGVYGTGTLTVSSGAAVDMENFGISYYAGAVGDATVTGTGSSLNVTNVLYVGYLGTGTLTVSDGASVTAASVYVSGVGNGTLNVDSGGVVAAGQFIKEPGAGVGSIKLDGGTLKATATQADFVSGFATGGVTLAVGGVTINSNGFDIGIASAIGGTGGLTKAGAGTLTLTGASTFTGTTTVYEGTLALSGGSLTGGVSVSGGATLRGGTSQGTVAGNVEIAAGGTLAGVSGTTALSLSKLTLADATSVFAVTLEAPSTTAAIGVTGDLALNGVLNLTAGAGFGSGTYRLIDYAGTLSGAGLKLGTAPTHALYEISTATGNQVNLLVETGQWWNGARLTPGTAVEGGDGDWNVSAGLVLTNWTNATGTTADAWSQAGLAIFAGTKGTVTVGGATAPQVAGMEFLVDGYVITGGSIELVGFGSSTQATILVGEGPDAFEMGATIASSLTGTAGLKKTGLGTLTLTGSNSYAGLTTVSAGTLKLTGTNTLSAGVYMTGGTLTIEGSGTLANTSGYIANGAGTTGTVVVTGADASWIGTGELGVGQGGQASFTVSAGAEASFAYSYVGVLAGSNGTATVTGKDSIWTSTSGINVGYNGTGTVNVEAGGTLTGATGIVGAGAGAIGTATVTGVGSTWTATTELGIGQSGTGTLNVAAGGKVNTGIGYIGVHAGAIGTATVTGEGSTWDNTAELHVGYSGTGTLTLEDTGHVSTVNAYVSTNSGSSGTLTLKSGATASSSFAYIGVNTGTNGGVTVTGADSLWTNSKDFVVGGSGSGQMTVSAGGGVSTGNGYIGQNALATGTATVTGADSSWSTGSLDLFVGLNGTGTLTVADGGAVSAAHVTLGYGATGGGTLNLDGTDGARGVLTTGQISKGAGQGTVNFNGGVVKASASRGDFLTGFADTSVTINAGGVTFDSNGFDIGVESVLSGTGSLTKAGLGTLTLTAANTYAGGTTVSAGTLEIGAGGATGSVAGAIANSGTVAFNRSDDVTAAGAVTGTGALVQKGGGKLTLVGANSAAAGTTVEAGTLEILTGVSLTSNVTVKSGATLQGETAGPSGAAITGTVSVENGGTLAAGAVTTAGAYGLSMTSLTLAESANISVTLGSNTGNAVFSAGTLALDGVLNVTDGGSMALGVYRIIDYTTLASDDGLVLGTTPLQYAYEIQQAQGQVNLAVLAGGMLFWNGTQTTPDGTIHGGDGTWTASSTDTNWTTSKANQSRAWDASFAVFSGTKGTVTIDDTAGAVAVTGVQFMVDGYEVGGDALTLAATSGQTQIRVGDGTGAGAAYVATIGSVITGSTGLEKTDLGTLILTGASTYTGGTTITQGILQIGKGGTTGAILGDVVNNAALVFNRSDDFGFDGDISGTGTLTKQGAGTLTLTGTNAFSGGLTVKAGTVKVAAASALGSAGLTLEGDGALQASESFSYGGAVTLTPVAGLGGGTFTVDDTKTLTLTGAIGGTGALYKQGTGTLSIAGNTYSGATYVGAGKLDISGGSSLSNTARLTVSTGATLTLKDANETVGSLAGGGDVALGAYCLIAGGDGTSSSFSGAFSGAGCLTKTGEGTLTLTGTSNHSGGTTISGGTVQVSAAAALGSGPLALEGGGTLQASDSFTFANAVSLTPAAGVGGGTFEVDDSKTLTLSGAITGSGALAKTGTGTLVLSGTNSASGATKVDEGILSAEGGQAIGDSSAVSVATGAQLTVKANETVGSIAGAGALVLEGAILTGGGDNTSTSFAGIISGTGGLTKSGTGTLTLSGDNTYEGNTTVSGGGLALTGSLAGDVTVQNLATLSGTGSIAKTVHVLDGGTLEGAQPAGLTMGGLDLAAAATVSVSLGAPSSDAVFTVNGDVTLDGTLKVTQTADFGVGVYRVMNYTGTLTDNGMQVSSLTGGLLGGVQTSIANQVNLLVEGVDTPILFWNGANTTATQTVLGGTGTWTAGVPTNWINASGTIPQSWNGAFAVFQGTPGTVTVDNTDGQVSATGLQFVESGYVVSGGALLLAGEAPVIRVGDGTEAGASSVATIASVLTGTHGLEKTDFGTLILTGANSYTGGTTISGGTLQIGDGGSTGAILGDVVNNAVLAFNRDDDATMAGAISGSGALVQAGEGTLYLTGANTSTGGTTIAAGTLRVDAASALGSGGLTVSTYGTLRASGSFTYGGAMVLGVPNPLARPSSTAGTIEVDSTQALTLSGAISGTAGLTKTGDGLLILTGTSTYAGVTTISAGTLQIGNGGTTGSIAGDVVNNAKLVFNRSDTYAFTGAITGSGEVTFIGGGTVLFSAPYTGAVMVDDSTVQLVAASSTGSTFTVNEGGKLSGTASIGGLIVNDGGVVAPGYSPGTLTVNGPVAFNAGAVYQVDVTVAGGHDLITATGAVTLSSQASVEVLATPGRYPSTDKITILSTSSTLTGTFGSVTSDFAFLTPELTYDAKNVFLTLVYNGFNFIDYAHTPNQANVAVAAQTLGTGNAVYEAIFALPESAVAPALNQLSGEAYASAQTVIQQQSVYLRDAVGSRLRQSLTAPSAGALSYAAKAAGPATAQLAQGFTPTLWAEGFGGWGEVSGTANAASVNTTVGGVFGGIDVAVLDNVRVGLVGGYSRTSFDIDARSSQGSMDNYDIGLYAGAQFDALALRGGASYTWHDISMSRSVVFPGYYGSQDGDYTLGTTQLFGEIGYDLSVGPYAFEPFVGLAYVYLSGGGFTESGTTASALSVDGASQSTLYSTLGVRAATSFTVAGRTLTTSATLGWQHAFGDTTSSTDMLFASGGANPFTIRGVPIAEDVALVGLGLGYQLSDSAELQLNYAGQLADQTNQNTFSAQFSLKF